jgi:putative ABC transport system permease protein
MYWDFIRFALRSVLFDRIHLLCNAAIIVGTLTPILVLGGVKAGVYHSLVDDLVSNPDVLRLTTLGDGGIEPDFVDEVRNWPEVAFAALKSRSIAERVDLFYPDAGRVRSVVMTPTGPNDPLLPHGVTLAETEIAVSEGLAQAFNLDIGAKLQIIVKTKTRPVPLIIHLIAKHRLKPGTLQGQSILINPDTMDAVEAYTDGYALPQYGIDDGTTLSDRTQRFEGMRVYAKTFADVVALETRLNVALNVRISSNAQDIATVTRLGRDLNIAFTIISVVAAFGAVVALAFSFWSEAERNRHIFATFTLLGSSKAQLMLFPLTQAVIAALIGVTTALLTFLTIGSIVGLALKGILPPDVSVIAAAPGETITYCFAALLLSGLASSASAAQMRRVDPAEALRERV